MQKSKFLIPTGLWPLVIWLFFSGCYAGLFFLNRSAFIEHYQYTVSRIPSVMLYGAGMVNQLETYGSTYGGFLGIAIGLVYLILAYISLGIFALIRVLKTRVGAMLALLIATLPIDALAYSIQFQPQQRTAISSALSNFVGMPFWYTALAITSSLTLLLILSFFYGTSATTTQTNA